MANFLERLFGRGSHSGTGQIAKDRLQFVLLHDRLNLAPERMEEMKREILAVISKYLTIDNDQVDIALQRRDSASLLVAEVPFLRVESGGSEADDQPDKPAEERPANAENHRDEPAADDW
jgi:cell division topological specificity factor